MQTIRIIIADDHQMVREGLRSLLHALPEVQIIAEAEDGRSAVRLALKLLPDVVVMDIAMPGLNGIDATRQLMNEGGIKVIALSGKTTPRSVTDMLRAGASGFVRKESAFAELADALRLVMRGRIHLSPALAEIVAADLRDGGGTITRLSIREREVLQLISEGKATKEIAPLLHVSIKTIETHRRNLMEKLKLDSVAELTKYAIREGIMQALIASRASLTPPRSPSAPGFAGT